MTFPVETLILTPIRILLDANVRPYARVIVYTVVLQYDNVIPHMTRIVEIYLEQETIKHMQCSARTPEINPIEHVMNALGGLVATLNLLPWTLATLSNALE
ncbi:hypothetical protein TNCV_985981 [Trichonephila clavipes]|uniref:Uncharacterized protein n=1 Tax=Trichonephila clavipes TaxID=2585209 RepID=A0A8X6SI82_TRICX|nr:hypothetical protein TNCV_985981 [Trichonephila clavipes]